MFEIDDSVKVLDEILQERDRQISLGWTPEHDDAHTGGSIAQAAGCYLIWGKNETPPRSAWTWEVDAWKRKPPRENLIRAAALIIAEIERLDRATKREQQE